MVFRSSEDETFVPFSSGKSAVSKSFGKQNAKPKASKSVTKGKVAAATR